MANQFQLGDIIQFIDSAKTYTAILRYKFLFEGKWCYLLETNGYEKYPLSIESFRIVWADCFTDINFAYTVSNIESNGNRAEVEYEKYLKDTNFYVVIGRGSELIEEDRGGLKDL